MSDIDSERGKTICEFVEEVDIHRSCPDAWLDDYVVRGYGCLKGETYGLGKYGPELIKDKGHIIRHYPCPMELAEQCPNRNILKFPKK